MLSCLNLGYYTRGYKFNAFLNKWSKEFFFIWRMNPAGCLNLECPVRLKHRFLCTSRVLGESLKLIWMKLALWRVSINPPSTQYRENPNTRWLSWFKNGMLTNETIMKTKNVERRTSIPEPISPCLCVCFVSCVRVQMTFFLFSLFFCFWSRLFFVCFNYLKTIVTLATTHFKIDCMFG